jgi:hypothetical protein
MVVDDPPTVGRAPKDKSEMPVRLVFDALGLPAPEHHGRIIA